MEVKTMKDFFELTQDGCDVCDSTIESPYCYMDRLEEKDLKDDYYRFVDYVERNTEIEYYNPHSPVGRILAVKYLDFLKKDIDVWIKFTNEHSLESFRIENYDNEDEFIEDALVCVLEQMLVGGYSEKSYGEFLQLIKQKKAK